MRFVKLFPDIAAIIGIMMPFRLSFEHRSPRGITACEIEPGMASFAVKQIFLRTKMIRAYVLLFAAVTMLGGAGQAQAESFDARDIFGGGIDNPLGARAMYLGSTLYRIHGSNEPETIGQAVSSGCFRMTNEDVEDLYDRVSIGTTVVIKN